jgi:hypothetical protein
LAAVCGRYTVTNSKADDLAARFDAIFTTRETVEEGARPLQRGADPAGARGGH